MLHEHTIGAISNNAPAVTYSGAGAAVLFWGLHLSDIAVILSAFASICGVGLQFYVALHRIRRLEKAADANVKVTTAMAETVRVLDVTKEDKGK